MMRENVAVDIFAFFVFLLASKGDQIFDEFL
jgi:hypothetical protein